MELLQNLSEKVNQNDQPTTKADRLQMVAQALVANLPIMVQSTATVFLNSYLQFDTVEPEKIDAGIQAARDLLDFIEGE